jgi:hypothetical protein
MVRAAVIAALLSLAAAAQGPDLRETMLTEHNAERAKVGAPPLVWDDALADAARGYARQVARSGVFKHSDELMKLRQGENLFMGTRGAYGYDEMVGYWAEEKRDFVNKPTPDFSRTGNFRDVAHYTQMIWPATTRIGCAIASNDEADYLVCRYSPPGNVVGQRAIPLPPRR